MKNRRTRIWERKKKERKRVMRQYTSTMMEGLIDRIAVLGMGDDYDSGFTAEGEWELKFVIWWTKRYYFRMMDSARYNGMQSAYNHCLSEFHRPYYTASYNKLAKLAEEDLKR